MCARGGRHYSDRLCSDRRYSDNPQSGRPSISLARLGLCRNSRNLEKTARIGSRCGMHRKLGIDRGTEVTEFLFYISLSVLKMYWVVLTADCRNSVWEWGLGRVSLWGLGCPILLKSYNVRTSNTLLYCPWFSAFGSASFQSILPVGLFNCSQPPDVPTLDCRNSVCRNSVVYPCARMSSMCRARRRQFHSFPTDVKQIPLTHRNFQGHQKHSFILRNSISVFTHIRNDPE